MKVNITDDNRFLSLAELNDFESMSVREWFTKEPEDAWAIKKRNPYIDTKVQFVNALNLMPVGLWWELMRYAKAKNVRLDFDPKINSIIQDPELTQESFSEYIGKLFDGAVTKDGKAVEARSYQLDGVFKLLKFKKACVEITTSGGKTLMSYIIFKFLRDMKGVKRLLYIVPNKSLATQSEEKFREYEAWVKGECDYTLGSLIGGLSPKKKEKVLRSDVLFATYQSLGNIDDEDFFGSFQSVIVDECHHAQSKSIKALLRKTRGSEFVFGMTGTFPKEGTFDNFVIQSYIGPLSFTLDAFTLINVHKAATPVYVVECILNYASEESRKMLYESRQMKHNSSDPAIGMKLLKQEAEFANKDYNRFKYIVDIATKIKGNVLLLFGDVADSQGYGRKLYEWLRKYTDKHVYYADGLLAGHSRAVINQLVEECEERNCVIVGSQGTYAEGVDIKQLDALILAESFKSEKLLRQFIGRGMRLGDKQQVVMFDIVDDIRYGPPKDRDRDNYLWKQHNERSKVYNEQRFPVYRQKVAFYKERLWED